ncbi:hypothetical protein E4U61_003447 [Claviceps capensis]|nr:hypothetical protein E4U61_003447 [Claviceps capensis]
MSNPAGHDIDDGFISAFTGLSLTPESTHPPALTQASTMAETTSSAATTGSNDNSTTDAAIAMAPRLYDRYPKWDGDFDSFENWLLAVDLPLSDPEMAPRLGSAAHICGELFSCIRRLRRDRRDYSYGYHGKGGESRRGPVTRGWR